MATNKELIYKAGAAHHCGVTKTVFNTEKGWKQAGFCLKDKAKSAFSTKVWEYVPKFRKTCLVLRKVYAESEVVKIEEPKAAEEPKFFKEERIGNDTIMFYDEQEYNNYKWAKDKAWFLFHQGDMDGAKKYSNIAKAYAGC